jgi:general secretion pathway protein C
MRIRSRRWWLLPLTMLLASAVLGTAFVAEGLNNLLSEPATTLADAALVDGQRSSQRAAAARQLGERVLARNIFDSATGALAWDAPVEPSSVAPAPAPAPAAPAPGAAPPRCGAGLRLVASVVNAVHPEHSFAALRQDDKTQLLALGARMGELTLYALRPTGAYLQASSGSLCFVPVFLSASERPRPEPRVPATGPARAPGEDRAKAKTTKPPLFAKEELERGVTPLGKAGYAVSRELLLRALKDPGAAGAGAQFKPVERDGHTVGMEVRAVRKGSPLEFMGIQNGDVVRSLNGADLTTPVGLLGALSALRSSDTVMLQVVRDNVPRSIQYLLD